MAARTRLDLELLEPRHLCAILLDSMGVLRIDEGGIASLAPATFIDTTPGGSYTATVNWNQGGGPSTAAVTAPTGSTGNLQIRFDYRFDTSGFFGLQQRAALETAAQIALSRLGDLLNGFQSLGINQFTATFTNPATGSPQSLGGFGVGFNEFIIFVGARDLPDSNLGSGGPGGGSARQDFFNEASARGQFGWPQNDFAPWGGAISFDSLVGWNFDISAAGLGSSENDFISVATHEIFHVLGVSPGVESFDQYVVNGQFQGPATRAANGGNGPAMADDDAHFLEGVMSNGQEALMDPTITTGTRKLPTALDWAVLDDLGWDVLPAGRKGEVRLTHVYTDNGTFNATVTVNNGAESDVRTFQVVVSNVAPDIVNANDLVVPFGQTLNLSVGFVDPGTGDTHSAMIDWGDGSGEPNATVNQTANQITGSHRYAAPGTYPARVRVQDDDGASDIHSFNVTVTSGPRGDWQNPNNSLDVNNNGFVDPLDALLIINELTDRLVSHPTTGVLPPAPVGLTTFLDVTGDDIVAPIDALLVINSLDSNSARAASSSAMTTTLAAPSRPLAPQLSALAASRHRHETLDEMFADLFDKNSYGWDLA